MRLSVLAAAAAAAAHAAQPPPNWRNVAPTPPMGWNSWNFWGCNVNETHLRAAADAFVDSGLAAAGYEFVNSDDCWMLANRTAAGDLIPNPDKFPSGLNATVAYIHGKGLKAGLYIARAQHTCAGFAGACGYEAHDAAWFVAHSIDYLKDDACGSCGADDWLTSYGKMQAGFWATGVPTVLSVEGDPAYTNMSYGGFGNMRRVGHDITPTWWSAVSLVDIGSGLWSYAHNATMSPSGNGGFWVDLDMLENGNAEFNETAYPAADPQGRGLTASRAHFSLWTLMKAPLILGSDLEALTPATLSVIANKDAIAVNQDPLGIQGRRVAVYPPANATLGVTAWDAVATATRCDAAAPTQRWRYTESPNNGGVPTLLYVVDCNASDPTQQWDFAAAAGGGASASPLRNVGTGLCVDAAATWDPASALNCSGAASQQWGWSPASLHINSSVTKCLDLYDFSGPDVEVGYCKTPGVQDANQQWAYTPATRQLVTQSTGSGAAKCLALSTGPTGGTLATTDADGNEWCLTAGGSEGSWGAHPGPCVPATGHTTGATLFQLAGPGGNGPLPPANAPGNWTIFSSSGGMTPGMGWNNQPGASGPMPHSRYIAGSWGTPPAWTLNLTALTGAGGAIVASDHLSIIDDDLVGGVAVGGDFCLTLSPAGMLEVWTGPLTGGAYAAVLFNRSPAPDAITLRWADLDAWRNTTGAAVPDSAAFAVRDVWAAADVGTFTGSYTATAVPAHGVVMLILRPATA